MKHSLFKILLYTPLLVLVNWIQGCGGNDIDLKRPTSIAPAGKTRPASNPTPNSDEITATTNPQESDAFSTASESLNDTASGTTRNCSVDCTTEATTNFQVDNPTPNGEEITATIDFKESSESSTTSSTTSLSTNSQESNKHTNAASTRQHKELEELMKNLPPDVLKKIDNYLTQGSDKTAINSLRQAMELLTKGKMDESLLVIFKNAINMGAEEYVRGFCGSSDYYKIQDQINKELAKIGGYFHE